MCKEISERFVRKRIPAAIGEWLIRKIVAVTGVRPYAPVNMSHSAIWSMGRLLATFQTDKQEDRIVFRDSKQRVFLEIVTTDRYGDVIDKMVRDDYNKVESTNRRRKPSSS